MPIIGHQNIISFFESLIQRQGLAQSYCFVGKDMVGKKTMARFLAARLLEIDEKRLDTHPDFYYVDREIDEKTEKIKKEISIGQTRKIKERLGNGSWFGKYQVVIIDEAELLNEESGNALLKILEEGNNKRVFFLLSEDESTLLPTIKSRCQRVEVPLVPADVVERGLIDSGCPENLAREVSAISWGRPGRALRLYRDEQYRAAYYAEQKRWQDIVAEPLYKKIASMEDLFAETKSTAEESVRTAEKIQEILQVWQMLWRDVYIDLISNKKNVLADKGNISPATCVRVIDDFKRAQTLLQRNVNPKLIIEQLLLNIN
jgi:DNA polymerase-3 subunit delta'